MGKEIWESGVAVGTIAIIILMAVALFVVFERTLRTETLLEINITLADTNESVAIGTTGQYPYPKTAISCINSTGQYTMNSSVLRIDTGQTDHGGTMTLLYNNGQNDDFEGYIVDCDIQYLADSVGSNTADDFTSGVGYFALFMGVLVIAFFGFVIVRMYSGKKGGKL